MRGILVGLAVWLGVLGTQALATNLTFDFNNASCTGAAYQVGYTCTYDNVASNTKAEIELVDLNNVRVDKFDDESLGVDEALQPRVIKINGAGWGYAEFEVRFYDNTGAPVLLDFPATSVDVDGNGRSEKEGVAYLGIDSYTLEQDTKLEVSVLDADRLWYWFYAKTYAGLAGIDYTSQDAPKHMAHTYFRKRHVFRYRAYVYLRSGNSSSSRMFSVYFKDSYNGSNFPNWENANTSTVGRLISGRVLEDVAGDGAISGDPGRNGVTVRLFKSDGTLLAESVTGTYGGEDGWYSFVAPAAERFVVADARTLSPSSGFNTGFDQGDVWAEQTYGSGGGWGGALCDDDGDSSTSAQPRSSNGACYGGRRGNTSDDASSLAGAEHVAQVLASNDDVTGVDFGFSFNVVTNTSDQDDDAGESRTAQGSLRQFIQNANAISGANAMRFVPAVPANQGAWWSVDVQSNNALPAITDGETVIDGTAYDLADGTSVRNTNAGYYSRNCTTVGVDQVPFTPIPLPELEVVGNDTVNWVFKVDTIGSASAANIAIRNLAVFGSGEANTTDPTRETTDSPPYNPATTGDVLVINAGDGLSIDHLLVGLRADGTVPSHKTRANGINFFGRDGGSASYWTVEHNAVAHTGHHGIYANGSGMEHGVVRQNDATHVNWLGRFNGDGISLEIGAKYVQVEENCVVDNNGPGIEAWHAGGDNNFINNTVSRNGLNPDGNPYVNGSGAERFGVRLMRSDNLFEKNIVAENYGAGVVVTRNQRPNEDFSSTRNRITQNIFYDNGGIAIDLDQTNGDSWSSNPRGDGVTPNDGATSSDQQNEGVDYPIFTSATLNGNTLELKGYIGSNKDSKWLSGDFTLEIYKADNDTDDDGNADNDNDGAVEAGDGQSKPHGEGAEYLGSCTVTLGGNGTFTCTLSGVSSLGSGGEITATATDSNGNTSEFGANKVVGVRVSGRVYEDLQPNAGRETGEDWQSGSAVYIKLVDGNGSVVQVTRVDPGDGAYHFDVVAAGDYTLIVDDNDNPADAAPNPPSGWLFVSPPDGRRSITVGTRPIVAQDFGLFHGARVEGVVFRDTGDGAGTANDAVQNGDEPGVPNVTVSVSDGSHTRTATTDASGRYLLYVPAGWGKVTLSHGVRPASGYNAGGSGVHQAANWADASATNSSAASVDLGAASGISGQTLAGRNFGVVYKSSFRPDQQGAATSPGTVAYAHTYKPGTQGTVSFSRAGGDYTYQLRLDANCDGDFDDAGESWRAVSATAQPSFAVDDDWPRNPDGSFAACNVEVRALVPGGEPEGAVDIAQISASLTWSNNGSVADPASLTDITTVRTNSTLQLEKVVRNVTQDPNSSFGTSAGGRPGDVLEYCIRYRNTGAENVTQVAISDPVPFFSDMVLGVYNGKDILWHDAAGATHELTAAADGDEGELGSGLVKVHAEATLQPGAGGEVCYRVELR